MTVSTTDPTARPGKSAQAETPAPEASHRWDGRAAVDRVFADAQARTSDFRFDERVSTVFDDMVERSVPFYGEIQRMVAEIAGDFATPGSNVYDLGCSTGTSLEMLDSRIDPSVRFIGFDNAPSMLEQARAKLGKLPSGRACELVEADIHALPKLEDASVVLLVLTLQFVRPLYRERLIRHVCEGMAKNGCLILVEKITSPNGMLNRLFIEHYYDMKRRNGYSDLEIAKKREALENVLIPYRFEENVALLQQAGFGTVEEFFRWYNFSAMVAVKT